MALFEAIPRLYRALNHRPLPRDVFSGTSLGTQAITETIKGYGTYNEHPVVLLKVGQSFDSIEKAIGEVTVSEYGHLTVLEVVDLPLTNELFKAHSDFMVKLLHGIRWETSTFFNVPERFLSAPLQ